MATYHGADQVEKLGMPRTFRDDAQPDIPDGCRLVVVRDNGAYRVASDATQLHDWQSALRSVSEGVFYDMKAYLLTPAQLEQCPDTGRAPSRFR
jgi:hypothetical protein